MHETNFSIFKNYYFFTTNLMLSYQKQKTPSKSSAIVAVKTSNKSLRKSPGIIL